MPTLVLTDVPPDVIARLERMATLERSSVNAVAVRALGMVSRRADNARMLEALPESRVPTADVLAHLDEGRAE